MRWLSSRRSPSSTTIHTSSVAPKDLPFNSAKELAASPKAKSGEMRLAHPGVGTGQHLAGVAFMKYTGAKFLEVPYRGASAIYPDLITGRVDLFFDSTTGALPGLKGGQIKGLGVLMPERMKDMPDIPTMKEEGLPNLTFDGWMGIFAPANTPKPAIERLQKEIAASMPDLKARFVAAGGDTIDVEPRPGSKASCAASMRPGRNSSRKPGSSWTDKRDIERHRPGVSSEASDDGIARRSSV